MSRNRPTGFSLIELSVVLVIVSVVVATGIELTRTATQGADRLATQEKLAIIKKALTQFARQNGYLPCPADRTQMPANANYGVERRAYSGSGYSGPFTATFSGGGGAGAGATLGASVVGGAVSGVAVTAGGAGYTSAPSVNLPGGGSGATASATIINGAVAYVTVPSCSTASGIVLTGETYIGMVPVRTLGLPDSIAADSWSDKITYAVNWNLTNGPGSYAKPVIGGPLVYLGTSASTQLATLQPAAEAPGFVNGVAAFVVISHGPDRRGAFPVNGTSAIGTCGSVSPDAENCDNDNAFIDFRYVNGDVGAIFFDDYVVWDTNLAGQAPLSTVTTPNRFCPTSPAVCEPWCAQCTADLPVSRTAIYNPQLCRRLIIGSSPCKAACLWSGTIIASGKYIACP